MCTASMGMGPHAEEHRTVFSQKKIDQVMTQVIYMGQSKSKKWDESRFQNAMTKLLRRYDKDFKFTAKVKIEPMNRGKAPRLLIADGEDGQLMALLGIHVFEELVFEKYQKRSIKHRSRKASLMELIEYLNGPESKQDAGTVIYVIDLAASVSTLFCRKVEKFTYISSMFFAYVRESPPPRTAVLIDNNFLYQNHHWVQVLHHLLVH